MKDAKIAAGRAGAELIENNFCVGLGTGSTTMYALEHLGRRIRSENLVIRGVATSVAAEMFARNHGIPVATLDDVDRIDIALDGADEVDADLNLIKGRGGAHTREKVIASVSGRFVVLVDETKIVSSLATRAPVPVEVLPMAHTVVARAIQSLGGRCELRTGEGKDGPVVTDQGFWILDVFFEQLDDPERIAAEFKSIPGVLDHGLFIGMATDLVIGRRDGSIEHRRRGR